MKKPVLVVAAVAVGGLLAGCSTGSAAAPAASSAAASLAVSAAPDLATQLKNVLTVEWPMSKQSTKDANCADPKAAGDQVVKAVKTLDDLKQFRPLSDDVIRSTALEVVTEQCG